MKDNNKNNYLISCVCSIFILMTICYFGIGYGVKSTYAGFGGLSGCMIPTLNITYDPNYPDGIDAPEDFVKASCEAHKILENMFEVPEGYVFNGWNEKADGSGRTYHIDVFTIFSEDATVYAQWLLIPVEKNPVYGDVDGNGKIEENDYLLILDYLNDSSILTDDMLVNADVNDDDKVDEIDADIINQVILGTPGYVGYLPEEIVPIYSKYEGNITDDELEDDSSDDEVNSSGSTGSGNGSGTGTGGNGTSSNGSLSGIGTDDNASGNVSGNKPSINSSSNKKPTTNNKKEENNDKDKVEKIIYNFKFYNDNKEFDNTSCETLKGSTCNLILPKGSPGKNGYTFTGWSLVKDCPSESGITKTMAVNSDNTYYACFQENEKNNNVYTYIIVGFIITIIWGLAIYGICYFVKKFKKFEIDN